MSRVHRFAIVSLFLVIASCHQDHLAAPLQVLLPVSSVPLVEDTVLGDLYDADVRDCQVVVVDANGLVRRWSKDKGWSDIGRKGRGPGEFVFPSRVTILPNGDVVVVDWGRRSLLRFSRDGAYIGEKSGLRLPLGFRAPPRIYALDDSTLALAWLSFRVPATQVPDTLLRSNGPLLIVPWNSGDVASIGDSYLPAPGSPWQNAWLMNGVGVGVRGDHALLLGRRSGILEEFDWRRAVRLRRDSLVLFRAGKGAHTNGDGAVMHEEDVASGVAAFADGRVVLIARLSNSNEGREVFPGEILALLDSTRRVTDSYRISTRGSTRLIPLGNGSLAVVGTASAPRPDAEQSTIDFLELPGGELPACYQGAWPSSTPSTLRNPQ